MYRPGTASAQAVTVKTGLLVILPQLKYFRHSSMVFFDRDLLLVLDSERRQGGSAVESRWHSERRQGGSAIESRWPMGGVREAVL